MYELGPVKIEALHHSWFEQTALESGMSNRELIVKLKPLSLKKIRDPRLLSKMPTPMGAQSRLGMKTNDFMDIRSYSYGDPYRSINWKATSEKYPVSSTPGPGQRVRKRGKENCLYLCRRRHLDGPWLQRRQRIRICATGRLGYIPVTIWRGI